jgi:iron(III) transport system substrate-binding protein
MRSWSVRFSAPWLLALSLLFVLAACGDGQEPAPPEVGSPTPTAQAQTPSAPGGSNGSDGDGGSITVYSGRSESLVQPLFDQFERDTGIKVNVRYGDTAELAATILEEGRNSPADVFFAQDAGALGAVAEEGVLAPLPETLLDRVPSPFRSRDGLWVGVSGRARVVVYNTDRLTPEELPDSILDFTDPQWKGRIGWAPTNGSFQAFVTALRLIEGEVGARAWLEGIKANGAKVYENNTAIVEAVARGEVDVGFVNHYYLYRFLAEQGEGFSARNHFLAPNDPGNLINVAGVGILETSSNKEVAERFVDYLLSAPAQRYFAEETFEYPLIEGVRPSVDLTPLSEINPPDIDLSQLSDLQGTLDLLRETGVLP